MYTHPQPRASTPMKQDVVNAQFLHNGVVKPLAYGSAAGAVTAHTMQSGGLGMCLGAKDALMAGLGTGGVATFLCAAFALGSKLKDAGVKHDDTLENDFAFEQKRPQLQVASLRDLEPYAARHKLH